MKQIRVFFLLFSIIIAIASCVRYEEVEKLSGRFEFTVHATMPELEESQTKVSTGVVVRLNWKEGDRLSVINLTTGKVLGGDLAATSAGVTTNFSGTLVGTISSSDNLLFLYPAQGFTEETDFNGVDIDFSNQTGKSGVDVCAYAIGHLGTVSVSGVSANFKFLMSYVEMNLSDLESSGTINTVKVENMGAGVTLTSNSTNDDILTTPINGTITLSPSTKVNASGSCAVFLSTFASSAPTVERKVIVNTTNTNVATDWSKAALKSGKFYNTIITGFEDYVDPTPSVQTATLGSNVIISSINNNWTEFTAEISADVLSDGGATVTERGVMFGTSESAITSTVPCSTSGTGSYNVTVSGLAAGTQYFAKAYAVNSEGTSYSSVVTFSTPEAGNGFNWSAVSHSVSEAIDAHHSSQWFVSDGVLYCDSGGTILTVDDAKHTITASTNLSDGYRESYNRYVWTGPDGSIFGCWTNNKDSEYDDYFDTYRFENGEWTSLHKNVHFTEFTPDNDRIWRTKNYVYAKGSYSDAAACYRSSDGYNFSSVTISNGPSYWSKSNIWTSASGTAYLSSGSTHYRFNESSLSWTQLSASSWPSINAADVFIVGSITYWVSGGDCYLFDESNTTWTKIDNDFRKGLYGRYVWSLGSKYYYSDGTVNKELKQGGQSMTTGSLLCFPYVLSSNPSIYNVDGNIIWSSYLKTSDTYVWNKITTNAKSDWPLVTFSLSMSDQYYRMYCYLNGDDYYEYEFYPIDPTSGICSTSYTKSYNTENVDEPTYYAAQSFWKDRNGTVHYSEDRKVFNDVSGRCYYCCDSNGKTSYRATHYRIYDETKGWSMLIPLNTPELMYARGFWSDGDGIIYYTHQYTQYQLTPKD